MAAKTWEQDFRFPAIQASIRRLRAEQLQDPLLCEASWCVPVSQKPAVGWTPGRITLLCLIFGFALLGGGAWLASLAEKQQAAPHSSWLLAAGVCSSLSGMLLFFIPSQLDRQIVRCLIGQRADHLCVTSPSQKLLCSELSHADRANVKISIDGDDHVLILADPDKGELLMEGTAARYRIRSQDVSLVAPFQIMNYVGVEITCRIDDETTLNFALARVSMLTELIAQLPLLFFLRSWVKNPLLDVCRQTLQTGEAE
ncbi:MAG: hypothetical protein R3C49_09905 [Planctomycetaceae bacterium]